MICGLGVDLVDVARFARQLDRTPALRNRLFTRLERDLPVRSLAARFAAKEALIKALGGSGELGWQDIEIVRGANRAPGFSLTQALADELALLGAGPPWVSLAHDGDFAVATVVIEREPAAIPLRVSEVSGTLHPKRGYTDTANEGQ